jgi:hypothetical protein
MRFRALLICEIITCVISTSSALEIILSTDGTNPAPATMDVTPDQEIDFYLISDTGGAAGVYWAYLEMDSDAPATINDITALPASDYDDIIPPPFPPEPPYEIIIGPDPLAGPQYTWTLHINSDAPYLDQFSMWITAPNDDNYPVEDIVDFTVVPEPMTIALLGLGGLFLRRRK